MTKLKERPLITYSKPTLLREVIREVEIHNLADLFRESNFVTTSMIEIWNLAVDFYEKERLVCRNIRCLFNISFYVWITCLLTLLAITPDFFLLTKEKAVYRRLKHFY